MKILKHQIKSAFLLLIIFLCALSAPAQHYKKDGTPDKRYKENRSPEYKGHSSSTYSKGKKKSYASYANRDSDGKIKRSSKAKYEFMKQSGYPKGRPGYVVDHIIPLKKGGCDCPSNMQWQTKEEAKRKDKWE
jgi:hypothetical protein